MWVHLYRMHQRLHGPQNRKSSMPGPEVTIVASNVTVLKNNLSTFEYLSSPVEDNIVDRWTGKGRPRTTIQARRIR